jgi:hypothetical protein
MSAYPRSPMPHPRQWSLLPMLTALGPLTPELRREAVALLAALLIEAAGPANREVTDERD